MIKSPPAHSPEMPSRGRGLAAWLRRHTRILVAFTVVLAAAPYLAGVSALADLLAQFLLQGAVASAALGAVLIVQRRRGLGAIVLLCLGAQLWVLTDYSGLKPAMASAHASGPKIISLNVWGRNRSHADVIDFVRRENADVVVLIEVTRRWRTALKALERDYPYRIDCLGNLNCDLLLLSKRPWQSASATHDRATYASVIEARLMLDDGPLTVIGTHLMRPIGIGTLEGQMAQADVLARHIEAAPGRKVVVGDFNAVPWGRVVTALEARTGLRALPGLEGTWPAQLPWPFRLAIDQALVSADAKIARRRVGPPVGSDHSPVIVELATTPN